MLYLGEEIYKYRFLNDRTMQVFMRNTSLLFKQKGNYSFIHSYSLKYQNLIYLSGVSKVYHFFQEVLDNLNFESSFISDVISTLHFSLH